MASKLKQQLFNNKVNIIYTLLILVTHIFFGIIINILGPVLVDLRIIYSVSLDNSSFFTVATNIGYLSGSLGFWIYGRLNRQLVMAFFVLLMGIASAMVPHYGYFWALLGGFVVSGMGAGAWDSACEIWMIEIFPVGNAGMLQFLQFCYGLGAVIAPFLVAFFVKGEATVDAETGQAITVTDRINLLTVPFLVSGIGSALISASLLLLFFTRPYKPTVLGKESSFAEEAAAKIDPSSVAHRNLKLAICGICLASYSAVETGWFSFSSAMFQYIDIKLDATSAALMQSYCSSTFTLGRLITAFIATRILPDIIITYHMITFFVGLIIVFFGRNSQPAIIVGSVVLGYAFSAIWPAMFAFTERHLRLSHRICSTYCFLAGLLSLTVPLILGQTFQQMPMILFAIEAFFSSIMFASFALINILIFRDTGKCFSK